MTIGPAAAGAPGASSGPAGAGAPGASSGPAPLSLTYAGSGVDLEAGEEAARRIARVAAATARPGVMGGIGAFAGLFDLAELGYRDPLLVASTDGVGTKAWVASATVRYSTIGIDLVAMLVDDLACSGAEPLFVLDYLAVDRLSPEMVAEIVSGVADGCRIAGAALLGGETAEHRGGMGDGDGFDLAGTAIGVVERDRVLSPAAVRPGDVLVGLCSPGLRCNGYSLARAALLGAGGRGLDAPAYTGPAYTGPAHTGAAVSLADELLRPSVIYARHVNELAARLPVAALAHITGGGIAHNLARAMPPGCDALVDRCCWEVPPIFAELQRAGGVADAEMWRVFNMGIGMIAVIPAGAATDAVGLLGDLGLEALAIGSVTEGTGGVRLVPQV
ncbi:MAG: phosphoribosylformylglycinamidine cyclo-ligase [Acidimicrobiales bacterium]